MASLAERRRLIIVEIKEELIRQEEKWGGQDHDEEHSRNDWVAFITGSLGNAVKNGNGEGSWDIDGEQFHKQMIHVAALAVSALVATRD